jgi:hypothetical protein
MVSVFAQSVIPANPATRDRMHQAQLPLRFDPRSHRHYPSPATSLPTNKVTWQKQEVTTNWKH